MMSEASCQTAPTVRGLGKLIYFLLYRVFRYRYGVVIQNLSRSFPEKSYGEIKRIAGSFYRHFSQLFVEMATILLVSETNLKKRLKMKNPELLEHYHQQKRNIIIMMGHYGNWELVGAFPLYYSMNMYAVYKPLSNRFFGRLVHRIRTRFGLQVIPMERAARFMLTHQHIPGAYIFVADQSPAKGAQHQVQFLHQPTSVLTGAERLAVAMDAVVVYAAVKKTTANRWQVSFSLITDTPGVTAYHEITRRFNELLEQDIRTSPDYWLWTHRRWKLNPSS